MPEKNTPCTADADCSDYVQELVRILARLRAPDGCPWDAKQTHESLKPYIVEEVAEFLDAVDERDDPNMAEELGDVLLQIVFHCQIAQEDGRYDLQTAARLCCEKMVRRHPHVFGETSVEDAEGVIDQWEKIKLEEKGKEQRSTSAVEGVPRHLPALQRARKIQHKAAKVGFDWPAIDGVLAKIEEELLETREALRDGERDAIAEEIGDLLFSVVNLSRFCDECPEELLHATIRKFDRRFRSMENLLKQRGKETTGCEIDELEQLWQEAKNQENEK